MSNYIVLKIEARNFYKQKLRAKYSISFFENIVLLKEFLAREFLVVSY